jgi:hypothetical protein
MQEKETDTKAYVITYIPLGMKGVPPTGISSYVEGFDEEFAKEVLDHYVGFEFGLDCQILNVKEIAEIPCDCPFVSMHAELAEAGSQRSYLDPNWEP